MKKILITCILAPCLALAAWHTAEAAEISGQITSQGRGVAGVPVSDGYAIVTTDSNGFYTLDSDKKLGYIFYTLPSGYEPAPGKVKNKPGIWAHLNISAPKAAETHNFELVPVDNKNFDLVVVTDIHLADRVNDLEQFHNGFVPRIKEFVNMSQVPVYTVALGDLSWDRYWYTNNYGPEDFALTLDREDYPTLFFSVTGNHDNDPSVPNGPETDHLASAPFRKHLAPTYYSFNLGDAHVVVLDDIVYKNEFNPKRKYAKGVVGNRNYDGEVTSDQLEWLKRDLELVPDKTKPLIICTHIPLWRLTFDGKFTPYAGQGKDGEVSVALAEIVKDFDKVRVLTGHTHFNQHTIAPGYPNIHEDNVSSLCCIFWNTKAVSGRDICSDGSPSAFKVYSFNGKDFTARMEGVAECDRKPFRVYDMNTVKQCYATDSVYVSYIEKYPGRTDYSKYDDNVVMVNVFDYEPDGKLTIIENGVELPVERVTVDDPLQIAAYPIPLFRETGKAPTNDAVRVNNHMFVARAKDAKSPVTVNYTDAYGRTSTQVLERPGRYDTEM